jgi:hypothetical protein
MKKMDIKDCARVILPDQYRFRRCCRCCRHDRHRCRCRCRCRWRSRKGTELVSLPWERQDPDIVGKAESRLRDSPQKQRARARE